MHYFCRIGASQSQMSVKTRGKQINFTSLAEGDLMSDEDVSGVASPSPRRQSNVIRCPVCDRTEDQTTAGKFGMDATSASGGITEVVFLWIIKLRRI